MHYSDYFRMKVCIKRKIKLIEKTKEPHLWGVKMHLQLNFKILLFQTTYNEIYPILLLKNILYRDNLEREREKKRFKYETHHIKFI